MSSRKTRALPWAIIAIIAVASLGAYFHFVSAAPFPVDELWGSRVRVAPGSTLFTIAAFLAELGTTTGVAACAAIVAALLFAIHQRREAAVIMTALLIGVALSQTLKYFVDRPRPLDAVYAFNGSSYPSGHSMGAAALAVSLAFAVSSLHQHRRAHVSVATVRVAWILAVAWVAAMMWSRTALGVHWLSDTVAGAVLGLAAALIAQSIWGRPIGGARSRGSRRRSLGSV